MKQLFVIVMLAAGAAWYLDNNPRSGAENAEQRLYQSDAVESAFEHRQSNVQVGGTGTVLKILADDNHGSRHQRFIVELASGSTLLIVHNIDLAPRIEALAKGDAVEFFGEYEWNEKGGLLHWTHHDPRGEHAAGWLKHDGRLYQ